MPENSTKDHESTQGKAFRRRTIRIPNEMITLLEERARRNHRTVQAEVLVILEQALGIQPSGRPSDRE
jgi:hypothetical protein